MADANDEANMREFIQERCLSSDYQAWCKAKDAALADISKPEIYVEYSLLYSRSDHEIYVNITPWLRTASNEDFKEFMAIESEDLIEEGEDGYEFLDNILSGLLDAEEEERHFRCSGTRMHMFEVRENIMAKIADIRPNDYHEFQPHMTIMSDAQPAML